MTASTQPQVALITGAAGGLGRALVDRFLQARWHVVATTHNKVDWPGNPALSSMVMDVTNPAEVEQVIGEATRHQGVIDCLVHNAGITCNELAWQTPDEKWNEVLDVNLKAGFRCARAVLRGMTGKRKGHILFISSFAGRAGARGQAAYAAAKAGLLGLTQSLAREVGSRNVRVNAVLPGVLPTSMTAGLTAAQIQAFAEANALGRINSLDEVAAFIAFLAGTENISGQVFQLDSRIAPWT